MKESVLKLNLYSRYVNVAVLWLFLSDVPMPVDKDHLAWCTLAALVGTIVLHLFVIFTGRLRAVVYTALAMDVVTVGAAVFLTGFLASPFAIIIPMSVYTVYFVEFSGKATLAFGAATLTGYLILVAAWWRLNPTLPSWSPRAYPIFSVMLAAIHLVMLATVVTQSLHLPDPLIQRLDRQNALLAEQRHRAELGTSLAEIVHEMRNPLTTVGLSLEHAELIAHRLPAAERTRLEGPLAAARGELARVSRMLDGVMSYARERRGTLHPAQRELRPVLERSAEFIRMKWGRSKTRFTVEVGVTETDGHDAAGPSAWVDADAMHQVLVNLLDNALQNPAPPRPLVVVLHAEARDTCIALTVRDNGAGIPAERLPRLFDRFVTGRADGTGLGLSIVRQLLRDQGAAIQVESTFGVGTSVTLRLPTDQASAAPRGADGAAPA